MTLGGHANDKYWHREEHTHEPTDVSEPDPPSSCHILTFHMPQDAGATSAPSSGGGSTGTSGDASGGI